MSKLPRKTLAFLILGLLAAVTTARAETVGEAWRSSLGAPRALAVNPADASCWVAAGGKVAHLGPDGQIQSESSGFLMPYSVAVNRTDGSCWVVNVNAWRIVHLSPTGEELWRGGGIWDPRCVDVNPADGSAWVGGGVDVVHLSATGEELRRSAEDVFSGAISVSVNSADSSCWVADYEHSQVVHLSSSGTELWRSSIPALDSPDGVSVNRKDGSCWVACAGHFDSAVGHMVGGSVMKLSSSGVEAWRSAAGAFTSPNSVGVNPTDGSCWMADSGNGPVVHFAADGTELWRSPSQLIAYPHGVTVNATDGSCWVMSNVSGEILQLSPSGSELRRITGQFARPNSVSANSADGSCWVADTGHNQVAHLSADGDELWRSAKNQFLSPSAVSVNPTDGSCWVADTGHGQAVHVSATGVELSRSLQGAFQWPQSVSANATDGSCWVADTGHNQVVHLGSDGAELWRKPGFSAPYSVSVDSSDGSCWIADQGVWDNTSQRYLGGDAVHISSTGAELWRRNTFETPSCVSVNSADGSCWIADKGHYDSSQGGWIGSSIAYFAANGDQHSGSSHFRAPASVSANSADRSCWATDTANSRVVHVNWLGIDIWRSSNAFSWPASVSVNPTDGSCWVADTSNSQIVHLTICSRFNDLPCDQWALSYVKAIEQAHITSGCGPNNYCPNDNVTRAQMAVFLSRSIGGMDTYTPPDCGLERFYDVPCGWPALTTPTGPTYTAISYVSDPANVTGRVISAGCIDTSHFCPDDSVTRAQMALFLARAIADYSAYEPTGQHFEDVPPDFGGGEADKAIEYIADAENNAVHRAITRGCTATTYCPDNPVRRDEMAAFLSRAFLGID